MLDSKTLVIKIGSNVLTRPDGLPDLDRMDHLVSQIQNLISSGKKVVLVSSGAVAFGRQTITLPEKLNPVFKKQKIGKHTSELQSRENLVCRLLLEKKKH